MQRKYGFILMTGFMLIAAILVASMGLNPVKTQTTAIMAIVPSASNTHSVVFQVCAEDIIMRDPEVKITSDIENKKVKLSKEIQPNTCRQTSATIQASDVNSIKLEKIDKSKINSSITAVEERILKIRSEISSKNSEIEQLAKQISEDRASNSVTNQKINSLTVEISKLRNDLKQEMLEHEQLKNLLRNYSSP